MRISGLKTTTQGRNLRISAVIESKNGFKQTLWVELDKKFKEMVADDLTAFTSPLVLPSSKRKENITIDGSVSTQWLKGVNKIIDRIVSWKHGFSPITVTARNQSADTFKAKNVGVFFSGGVDSFSSYLKYQKSKTHRVTHFIFVHGFDIALDNTELFNKVAPKIDEIAQQAGVPCITLRTNVREITDQLLGWEMAHGGALALIALLLRLGFKTIIIPGGGTVEWAEPWGSSAYLDPCWSTESLEIIHDLDERMRCDKVRDFIAKSPLALKYLRVCWRNKGYNCGECDKCLMTMVELRMADALGKAETFPKTLDLNKIRKLYTTPYSILQNVEQAYQSLQKTGHDPELAAALADSIHYSKNPGLKRQIITVIHDLDWKYNESRLFVFLSKLQRIKTKSVN
jgi:hypothetical protein